MRFQDRQEAGMKLAEELLKRNLSQPVVLAIPRGGVVLGAEIARALECPLDLVIVRKVGHPYNSEYALCVVAEDGERLCREEDLVGVDKQWLEKEARAEMEEARRRRVRYLGEEKPVELAGKAAILVDDGVATGLTFEMAIEELKHRGAARIVAALPVAPADFVEKIKGKVDEVVILSVEADFLGAVGAYYEHFDQVEDEEVVELLKRT